MATPELEAFIDEAIRLGAERGYHPTVFIGMRHDHGTVKAISRLVRSGDVQSGFKRLKALRLIEWTIEAAVLRFPDEFQAADIECAEFRLRLVGGAGADNA